MKKLLQLTLIVLAAVTVIPCNVARAAFDFTLVVGANLRDQYGNFAVYTVPAGYRWTIVNLTQPQIEANDSSRARILVNVTGPNGKPLDGYGLYAQVPYTLNASSISYTSPVNTVIVGPATITFQPTANYGVYATFRFEQNN